MDKLDIGQLESFDLPFAYFNLLGRRIDSDESAMGGRTCHGNEISPIATPKLENATGVGRWWFQSKQCRDRFKMPWMCLRERIGRIRNLIVRIQLIFRLPGLHVEKMFSSLSVVACGSWFQLYDMSSIFDTSRRTPPLLRLAVL